MRANPIGADLLALLPHSPDAYPQKLDLVRQLVLVIRLDASAYRSASFLDDRILGPGTQGTWIPVIRVTEAARQVPEPRPLHFIFHTGHVGSTLVSRLLDETGLVLPLREPLPLRTLADAHDTLRLPESLVDEAQFADLFDMTLRLWSRGYEATRAVIVKATSTASRMAGQLLDARPDSRAIYLNLRAEPYLATLLSGQNSAEDLRGHGPGRMRRLQALSSQALRPLHQLSIGELAALGWLVESASQHEAVRGFPERVLAIDFDAFLADVGGSLGRIVRHFQLPVEARDLARIGGSAVLNQYSKAPDRPYTQDDRAALLRESRQHNRAEIAKGLAWLEHLARGDSAIAAIITSAGTS
ncbi:MAG TPA: hypothetical protein VLB75_09100 [Steroidobacteraceae bacterium]|nr:hypothetical protein [Steroidobacteraceae bacterium]